MNKNLSKILIGVIILVLIILGIYFLSKQEEPSFKKVPLTNETNLVINQTGIEYYDTIIHVGLEQMGLNNITLTVAPLSESAKQNFAAEGGDLAAHLRESDGLYYLFISENSKTQSITIIAHELIHLNQYHTGELVYKNNLLTWQGKEYNLQEISYNLRPWEDDAFQKETELVRKISSILL